MTTPTSEPTLAQLLDAFEEAANQCGLDSHDHERGGISYAEWQRSVQKEEVARKALTAHVDALRTALANAEREREAANDRAHNADVIIGNVSTILNAHDRLLTVESAARELVSERDALQRTVAGMRERKDGVTLYLFDHGDCTMYCRNASTFLVEVMCGDELPESLFDDSDEGVFLVFDGVVHDNTQDATDEDLEARGLPTSAKHYDAWWVGSMRPATDVEILSVFGNEALTTPTREGSTDV